MQTSKHNLIASGLLLLMLLSASACSTVKSGYSVLRSDHTSWEGHSSQELLGSWGPPDATEELGNDYQAYTWTGDDGVCRRTFMARSGEITGYSESDC